VAGLCRLGLTRRGGLLGGYVLAVCGREVTMARRPNPGRIVIVYARDRTARNVIERCVPFRDAKALELHYEDHAVLLGAQTLVEYESMAETFMFGPLCTTCYECNRPLGGRARFDSLTSRYGVVSAWGHIATFMILESILHHYPTNWDYYLSRCN
jgi:hypothetical protein